MEIQRSKSDEWQVGSVYKYTYDLKAPSYAQDELQAKVDGVIQQYASDPRLIVQSYDFNPGSNALTVQVKAIAPSSPLEVVAYALIGLAALYLIYISLRSVSEIVAGINAGLKTGAGQVVSVALLIGVVVVAFVFFQRRL